MLPKNLSRLNMTNEEYMALSDEERLFLAENLPTNCWLYYSEAHPKKTKSILPCVISGVLVGE